MANRNVFSAYVRVVVDNKVKLNINRCLLHTAISSFAYLPQTVHHILFIRLFVRDTNMHKKRFSTLYVSNEQKNVCNSVRDATTSRLSALAFVNFRHFVKTYRTLNRNSEKLFVPILQSSSMCLKTIVDKRKKGNEKDLRFIWLWATLLLKFRCDFFGASYTACSSSYFAITRIFCIWCHFVLNLHRKRIRILTNHVPFTKN